MEIKIDTKHDSHEDIRKVIKMLQHLIGDSQEIFTNQPSSQSNIPEGAGSAFTNIFGDAPAQNHAAEESAEKIEEAEAEETSESTEDLFAELFSEEEIKKMSQAEAKDEGEETKPKDKKYNMEFY